MVSVGLGEGRGMKGSAVFDPTGKYRYRLERVWDPASPRCAFICLNPSTATAETDDQTVRKLIGFADRWGFGGFILGNIFAFRATNPRELKPLGWDGAVGPENDEALSTIIRRTEVQMVIAAWGAHGALFSRGREVASRLRNIGARFHCLGMTADGQPRHPLMLGYAENLVGMGEVS